MTLLQIIFEVGQRWKPNTESGESGGRQCKCNQRGLCAFKCQPAKSLLEHCQALIAQVTWVRNVSLILQTITASQRQLSHFQYINAVSAFLWHTWKCFGVSPAIRLTTCKEDFVPSSGCPSHNSVYNCDEKCLAIGLGCKSIDGGMVTVFRPVYGTKSGTAQQWGMDAFTLVELLAGWRICEWQFDLNWSPSYKSLVY
jgi:hypothetical protein